MGVSLDGSAHTKQGYVSSKTPVLTPTTADKRQGLEDSISPASHWE